MRRFAWWSLGGAALACLAGCRQGPRPDADAPEARRLVVVASLAPHAYFAERVAGSRARVEALVAQGQSPHTFEPLPAQVTSLAEAHLYLIAGMPFERPLSEKIRAMRPDLTIVDLRRGVTLLSITQGDAEHGLREGDADPHVWMDPLRAVIQARTIRDELVRLDPAGEAEYDRNLASLTADLRAVDTRLKAQLAPLRGSEMLVFHPAFGYFAAAYGLRQVALEHEGKEPDARRLGEIVKAARQRGAKVVFVQPAFSPLTAEAVARELGGAVIPLDDLAHDYLANLERVAKVLAEKLPRRGA